MGGILIQLGPVDLAQCLISAPEGWAKGGQKDQLPRWSLLFVITAGYVTDQKMHDRLRAVFNMSFSRFLEREKSNILNGVAERNLCACWAPLLEQEAIDGGFQGYRGDADYNRMQNGRVKVMLPEGYTQEVQIVCDLILHSRGKIKILDNLIAIEMKRSTRPEIEKESDRLRLKTLTRSSFDGVWSADGITLPEYVCGYQLGYYVEFNVARRSFLLEEFLEGAKVDERACRF